MSISGNSAGHPFRFLEAGWAATYDTLSFGFINLLQLRHPLPRDYVSRFESYVQGHASTPFEDFYAVPERSDWILPDSGRVSFPSPFSGPHAANNTAAFDLFPCAQGWSQPTMLIAHGLMSVSDIGYRHWARCLNAHGWNAVFCHLPYHYSRCPKGFLAGELAVTADLMRVVEGVRQAVVEARMLVRALTEKGSPYFGVWGTSYGGWVSALLCCAEPLVKRAILVEPILNIESAIWRSPATLGMRQILKSHKIGPAHTQKHLRLCCPSHARPLLNPSDVLLMAGEFDRIAHPDEIHSLHQAWQGSRYQIAPQGHVGYTLMPRSFQWARQTWPEDFALTGEYSTQSTPATA